MSLSFKSADGTTWPLDGSQGITVLEKAGGLYAPEIDVLLDQRVAADGGVLIAARQPPRPVDLPVLVSSDVVGIRGIWGSFLSAAAGGGTLTHSGVPDVRQLRELTLQSVTPGMLGYDLERIDGEVFTLSFLALDPWWYGQAVTLDLLTAGATTVWNSDNPWNASLPWNGGTVMVIDVAGVAPAYPVIDVIGPATAASVSIVGAPGWQSLKPLVLGQRLTVDHRPGHRGPMLGGTEYVDWTLLTEQSRLWTLPTGSNSIVVGVTGDTAATIVSITWEPKWLTP